jgi:predicted PurR-regulated permease PerM
LLAAAAVVAALIAGWEYLSLPVVVTLAAYLVYPFRRERWGGRLLLVDLVIGLCWLVTVAHTVFAPFVVAALIAYLGDPVVDRFEALGVSRSLAILILLLPIGTGVVLGAMWLGPLVIGEMGRLIEALPAAGTTVMEWTRALVERIPIASWDLEWESYLGEIAEYSWGVLQQLFIGAIQVGKGVSAIASFLSYTVLTPILVFYLLRDWDRIVAAIDRRVEPGARQRVRRVAGRLDEILGAYFRGQGLVCLAIGLLTTVGLLLLGVDFALLLGILAGLFNLVPVIGLIASVLPAIAVALLSPAPLFTALKVVAVFGVVQILEQAVLSPRLVGDRVGLHPALVMLAILVFPVFWGFVGILVAVPAMAALGVLLEEIAPLPAESTPLSEERVEALDVGAGPQPAVVEPAAMPVDEDPA